MGIIENEKHIDKIRDIWYNMYNKKYVNKWGKCMGFERNKVFDKLIVEVKKNRNILNTLDYEQLMLFTNYLIDLKNELANKGGN